MPKTLGQAALDWSYAEMARENPPSAETKAEWFRQCVRNEKLIFHDLTPEHAARMNHCAAAVCYAMERGFREQHFVVLPPTRSMPHGYRAAAKELMADAVAGKTWRPAAFARSGVWLPEPGDLAVYDRSIPGRPETNWWGHVDRVVRVEERNELGYINLGANEGPGGEWVEQWSSFYNRRLLGFIEYERADRDRYALTDDEKRHVTALQGLMAEMAEAEYWELKGRAGG